MQNQSGYPPTQPGFHSSSQPGPYPPMQPGFHSSSQPAGDFISTSHQSGPYPQPPINHQPQPGSTVIVQHAPALGSSSSQIVCPSCHATIMTDVRHEPNTNTHLFAVMLCICGCLPCFCIPYCMDSCQSANHYCPNCNSYLGVYNN